MNMNDRKIYTGSGTRTRHIQRLWLAVMWLMVVASPAPGQPKLVLQITIDQLRGDMPLRFKNRFEPGGLRYLMHNGVHFTNAHYRHSATVTSTGHATLFTGAHPAQHGIVANDWYSYRSGGRVNCVEDSKHLLLGEPTQPHQGTSPRNLLCSTIGDELITATAGAARVFSVSIKDRGAILPAGRLGKAFWYSSRTGRFITSSYYYDQVPPWAAAWNEAAHADAFRNTQWTLLHDRKTYVFGEHDDRPYERAYLKLGRTFPHPLGSDAKDFYTTLRYTPMGDVLTLSFVEEMIKQEQLGRGPGVDLLAVSFSCTDSIGHAFGPNSLEAEDNLLRLDRTLAHLFTIVDQMVGLSKTMIVLSSDHGVDAAPELLSKLAPGVNKASGRLDPERFVAQANDVLKAHFGTPRDLILSFLSPSMYLDLKAIDEFGLSGSDVEDALARHMSTVPGVAHAITRTNLKLGRVPDEDIHRMVQRSFHPLRSGHVIVVPSPGWYMHSKTIYSSIHGSPWAYDRYVPIMFVGPDIEPRRVHRRVGPEDIAPTIAMMLGIQPPSASVGQPLPEVLSESVKANSE
jgi:predicted AlkP superfamily pyrophosphatase or phosphodiesterase